MTRRRPCERTSSRSSKMKRISTGGWIEKSRSSLPSVFKRILPQQRELLRDRARTRDQEGRNEPPSRDRYSLSAICFAGFSGERQKKTDPSSFLYEIHIGVLRCYDTRGNRVVSAFELALQVYILYGYS